MVASQVETQEGIKRKSMMEVTRTFDLLEGYETKYADKSDVFASKENRKWVKQSAGEYIKNSH